MIDHDVKNQVGVIEEVSVDETDRTGRAVVRFGRSVKAEEIFQDVTDGIRSNVSVGYQVDEMVLEKEEKDKPSTYRVTRWEPYEISLVSVPADINVGVGRSSEEGKEVEIRIPEKEVRTIMKCDKCGADLVDGKCPACEAKRIADQKRAAEAKSDPPPPPPSAVEMERQRKEGIENLCKMNNLDQSYRDMFVGQGLSLFEVGTEVLKIKEERGKTNLMPLSKNGRKYGYCQRCSMRRSILACV